jgi:hypothetical protein
MSHEISIEIEPRNIFPIDSEIRFNCKFPQSNTIWWSLSNDYQRQDNPLVLRIGSDYINKIFVCHATDTNGKLYKKLVHIQHYSQDELMAVIGDNEMERSTQRKGMKIFSNKSSNFFSSANTPKMHIKLITPPSDIKAGGIVELHCDVEGIPSNIANFFATSNFRSFTK